MRRRIASINDLPIRESTRKYRWPLGRRPDGHPSLSELGKGLAEAVRNFKKGLRDDDRRAEAAEQKN